MRDAFLRFRRDRSGSYMVIAALLMPALVGFAGLATEGGLWLYTHQKASSAADSAAVSAARAGGNFYAEASGVTASYGFVDGANGVTVTVNQPPKTGNYTTTPGAVEVIVQQQQAQLFSALFSSTPFTVKARAVAVGSGGCVLALDRTANKAVQFGWMAQANLKNCSLFDNSSDSDALDVQSATLSALSVAVVGGISGMSGITTTNGIKTGVSPIADPYAGVSQPTFSGCYQKGYSTNSTVTINPGVYCNGMSIQTGADVTLSAGTYFLDQGTLSVDNGATISGTGVTLVFTSSNGNGWASAKISPGATVNLTAPTSGSTAGIVMFGDRNMRIGTSFDFEGGATQTFGGVIYVPEAAARFAGGSSTGSGCTQLIADTIDFDSSANTYLQNNCNGYGTKTIGSATAALVE